MSCLPVPDTGSLRYCLLIIPNIIRREMINGRPVQRFAKEK
ncbi:hypothetical protein ECDEC5B_4010 [Escherichia coli DEC5B]|nr:hypothetical protein ECDEC5B_4010 [Escherichia coli DEC5B]